MTKEKVLLIGASGFTGQRVLQKLIAQGADVTCFLRKSSIKPTIESGHYKVAYGNLDDIESLKAAMQQVEGVIYTASLGFGHAPMVVKACEESRIQKAVFTSTTAILTQLNAPSKKVRSQAEKCIQSSKIPHWTIIRPTMIYGLKGDRNMERLVRFIQKSPLVIIPGSGQALQQPNHVDDVATALVQAYQSPNTQNKFYNISGQNPLTFREVIQTIAQQLNKNVHVVPLPLKPVWMLLKFYEKLFKNPKFKAEQVLRLNENKAFDHSEAKKDFSYSPITFKKGIEILIQDIERHKNG